MEHERNHDRELIRDYRLKRLQRSAEYALLATMHIFFLLAFREYYRWWMAIMLAAVMFGMNFQLTQLREGRRTSGVHDRQRIKADVFESILFLMFIVIISAGGLLRNWLHVSDQEYLAYVAAILGGLFLAGMAGEVYWQFWNFPELEEESRSNYIANLKRTIILPYTFSRKR
ncbi:MAG: hypothetical protein JWQ98_2480 [Chlorobi bacterium]|nr:hypothetical protein [Chlorobiota bacterium]